ncbi:hypothetical protein [Aliiroseovarius sp. S253]|uniref:hypothetical protein n=1 Tax=Aliiroseovarius sp. S253 TaxID=3415133 RepID=UPI003C7E1246
MKQDISINGELTPLIQHHLVVKGPIGTCANTSNISIHKRECAVPPTPSARQNSFKDAPVMEGVERTLNACLRVEGDFDALNPAPAAAHAFFAQNMGAAGLAEFRDKAPICHLLVNTHSLE